MLWEVMLLEGVLSIVADTNEVANRPELDPNPDSEKGTAAGAANGTTIVVPRAGLRPVHSKETFFKYIRSTLSRKDFIVKNAQARAFQSDRNMLLGRLWIVLQPFLDAAMYGFLFGYLLRTSHGIDNFIGYLFIGITFFAMMRNGLTSGFNLMRSNRGLLTAFHFPGASLVVSHALRYFLDSVPPAVVSVVVALLLQWGQPVSASLLLVPILFVMVQLFSTGLLFFSARICHQIPDFKFVLQFGSRFWFFMSGVFYSVERFVNQPVLLEIMLSNPAYQFLTALRGAAMWGEIPELKLWISMGLWSLLTPTVGLLFFWRGEESYANA